MRIRLLAEGVPATEDVIAGRLRGLRSDGINRDIGEAVDVAVLVTFPATKLL